MERKNALSLSRYAMYAYWNRLNNNTERCLTSNDTSCFFVTRVVNFWTNIIGLKYVI